LVYVSAWLKCRYPDVFAAALLNSQPMGFYAPAQIVRDVREHGIEVRPIDINHSDWDATLEPHSSPAERVHALHSEMTKDICSTHALRLGFRKIRACLSRMQNRLSLPGAGHRTCGAMPEKRAIPRCATSGSAPAFLPASSQGLPMPTRSVRSVSRAGRRCGK